MLVANSNSCNPAGSWIAYFPTIVCPETCFSLDPLLFTSESGKYFRKERYVITKHRFNSETRPVTLLQSRTSHPGKAVFPNELIVEFILAILIALQSVYCCFIVLSLCSSVSRRNPSCVSRSHLFVEIVGKIVGTYTVPFVVNTMKPKP